MSKNISVKYKFPIEGLKWIPYIIGWVFGVFNLVFWIVHLIVGILSKDKHKFIDSTFHEIVYYWGIIYIVIILAMLIFGAFMISMLLS